MTKTTIALVEDSVKLRKHWVDEIKKQDDFELMFEANDENELATFFEKGQYPDFLVLDLNLGYENAGVEVLRQLQQSEASVHVVVCTHNVSEHIVAQTLALGAKAFVEKGTPIEITRAIRGIQREGIHVSEEVLTVLLRVIKGLEIQVNQLKIQVKENIGNQEAEKIPLITDEQMRVLKHLCAGLTFKEIAKKERLTDKGVEHTKDRLCVLFGATNRYELTYKAGKMGL
ncbi:MAG: response regulator transcription factor [Saprospiraceae bacterium]|nr:response regulator transcription factor [Saprospiraceae bacterium]